MDRAQSVPALPELALDQEDLSPHLALSRECPNSSAMDMLLLTLLSGLVPNSTLSGVEIQGEQGDSRTMLALPFPQPNSLSIRPGAFPAWPGDQNCTAGPADGGLARYGLPALPEKCFLSWTGQRGGCSAKDWILLPKEVQFAFMTGILKLKCS